MKSEQLVEIKQRYFEGNIKQQSLEAVIFEEVYGSDANKIKALAKKHARMDKKLPKDSVLYAEVVWTVQNEMVRTIEDFLARRRRILFLDARAAMDMAHVVAKLIASQLKKRKAWQNQQVKSFREKAANYIVQ